MFEAVLGLFVPTIALVLAITFVGLWSRMRSQTYVLAFGAGFFLLAIGFAWFHYVVSSESLASVVVLHAIFSGTTLLWCWGLAKRVRRTIPLKTYIVIEVIAGLMMSAALSADDLQAWMFTVNLGHALIFALTVQELSKATDRAAIDNILLGIAGCWSAMFFIRPVFTVLVQTRLTEEAYRQSGIYPLLLVTVAVFALALSLALVVAVLQDQLRSIKRDAELDQLTGLKMRSAFEAEAMEAVDTGADNAKPVSLIVADLDHFKQVNDIWGHQAGDIAIANFGRLIRDMVREGDLCGRVGGEEFCILVKDCDGDAAHKLAERVRVAFERMPHSQLGEEFRLTASFGVSTRRPGEGYSKVFARADAALYTAKEEGRNRVIFERARPGSAAMHVENDEATPLASEAARQATG